ncbi:hypothetical protein SEUCBS139899_006197 [Sporothrix eucalyptigena]|uniref:Developmental regulator n=1 Tax=Sporothrix eucalyptigena TaxID=1812306 RepID=A0ABP0AQC8_9PEZI
MPAYLCHGFRWHRPSIRVFVIVQDLDDASPDWVIRPATTRSLLEAFYHLFDFLPPHDVEADAEVEAAAAIAAQKAAAEAASATPSSTEQRGRRQSISQAARAKSKSRKDKKDKSKEVSTPSTKDDGSTATPAGPKTTPGVVRRNDGRDEVLAVQDRSAVKLIEEYDPQRLDEMSRPHAYVADYVARIDLSVSIVDEMARYERLQQQRWRKEHKTKDGFPSMAGPSEEGPSLGAALGASEGSGGATLSKRKKGSGWLEQLRDQLQKGEEIRWYIVVNDDEDRSYPDADEYDEEKDDQVEEEVETSKRRDQLRPDPEEEIMPERRGSLDDFMDRGFAETVAVASSPLASDRDRERDREREKERRRQRLRFELTGDPNILASWDNNSPPPVATRMSYRPGPGKPMLINPATAGEASTTTAPTPAPAPTPATGAPMVFSLPPKSSSSSPPQQQQPQQPGLRRDRSSTMTSSLNSNNIGDEFAFPQPPPMPASAQMQRRPSQSQPQQQPPPPQSSPPQPPLPPLSPPTLRPKKSGDVSGLRPKTPNGKSSGGASGFRRLFGRSSKSAIASEATK